MMPDDRGHPTADELQNQLAVLERVLDEAKLLREQITEQLRAMRRRDRTDKSGQPYTDPERRKAKRKIR